MSAEVEVVQDAVGRLEGAGIAYMITGSFALSCYVQPRMTRDIDFVVELGSLSAAQVNALFAPDYYVSWEDVARAIRERGMFNLFHHEKLVKLDFIVRKPSEYRQHEFERRQRVRVSGFDAWFVSKEDLILSKLIWAKPSMSELQFRDVGLLLASGADEAYLGAWAPKLGVDGLLERCRHARYDT